MSRWTYMRAVIPIVFCGSMEIEFGNKEHMDRARAKMDTLFKDKITGSERNAVVFYNFDPFVGSSTYRDGSWINYCDRCFVTITGDLRDRGRDEVIAQFKELVQNIIKDKDVYIEEWDSFGTIWETDEDRFDVYPLLTEMCRAYSQ